MCVVSLPTFAPRPLRGAWGLVEDRPALVRVVAPSALLRAAGLPLANHGDRTRPARGPGVLERPRGSAYAGGFRTHMTRSFTSTVHTSSWPRFMGWLLALHPLKSPDTATVLAYSWTNRNRIRAMSPSFPLHGRGHACCPRPGVQFVPLALSPCGPPPSELSLPSYDPRLPASAWPSGGPGRLDLLLAVDAESGGGDGL